MANLSQKFTKDYARTKFLLARAEYLNTVQNLEDHDLFEINDLVGKKDQIEDLFLDLVSREEKSSEVTVELLFSDLNTYMNLIYKLQAKAKGLTDGVGESISRRGSSSSSGETARSQSISANLESLRVKEDVESISSDLERKSTISIHRSEKPAVKLPVIDLPTFSEPHGDSWPNFKALFQSLIMENPSISPLMKLHYLRSSLKGEPLLKIQHLALTEANLEVAWSTLLQTYDNKRIMATRYWRNITKQPSVGKSCSLSELVTAIKTNLEALKALEYPVTAWDLPIVDLVLKKVDDATREQFENSIDSDDPSYEELFTFLEKRARSLQASEIYGPQALSHKQTIVKSDKSAKSSRSVLLASSSSCAICRQNHCVSSCKRFLALRPRDRFNTAKKSRVCIVCLSKEHKSSQCTSSKLCDICNGRHHSLLHFSERDKAQTEGAFQQQGNAVSAALQVSRASGISSSPPSTVLLSTALLFVKDCRGSPVLVRALLDSGSQCTLITSHLVDTLGLKRVPSNTPIRGITNAYCRVTEAVGLSVSPAGKDRPNYILTAFCVDQITGNVPSFSFSAPVWEHILDLDLADPDFSTAQPVELLLGADIYPSLLKPGMRKGRGISPIAVETTLGWVLIGPTDQQDIPRNCESGGSSSPQEFTSMCATLEGVVQSFWELEKIPEKILLSSEDEFCEKLFQQAHTRNQEGRYVVPLLFKKEEPVLGLSRGRALHRFRSLETRFRFDSALKQKYAEEIQDMINRGFLQKLSEEENTLDGDGYYIPHHAVAKGENAIRIVYDASARTTNGRSLNDCLASGPKLQTNLVDVFIGFRAFPVVLIGDIKQMFLQVRLQDDHVKYQKILWRFSETYEVEDYCLPTVAFGVKCSPFLAIRTVHQLVTDEGKDFPAAFKALMQQVYVDDLLTSCPTVESAQQLRKELVEILKKGGFCMRKWATNCPMVLDGVDEADWRPPSPCAFESDVAFMKVLGLIWDPTTDVFSYVVNQLDSPLTKRGILSDLARLFDPLGWLTPVILVGKLLIKELWALGLGWDDPVPEDLSHQWLKFKEQLKCCADLQLPRSIQNIGDTPTFVVHGFADASSRAYGACVYLVTERKAPLPSSATILIAKSRLAPARRKITIPRLELLAAHLLSQLISTTLESLKYHFDIRSCFCWTDSTVVLYWLRSSPEKWQTFVGNRIDAIQQNTQTSWWRHVSSEDNPADLASRGTTPGDLKLADTWWKGPEWIIKSQNVWPSEIAECKMPDIPVEEARKTQTVLVSTTEEPTEEQTEDLLKRVSSLIQLQRVTAFCLRFGTPGDKRAGVPLSLDELNKALRVWVKITQESYFHDDMVKIKKKKIISRSLARLAPFIDSDGILRVGGRLNASSLPTEQKHPMLLPGKARLTQLIIDFFHTSCGHLGPTALQAIISRRYWILSARRAIKSVVFQCDSCFRQKPRLPTPMMGDLPPARVNQVRPFCNAGVDFAGPILIKASNLRKAPQQKAYIAVFVCMSTRAAHVELVSDMTTEAFIACLDRFVSRRGLPANVYSDNGSNFVGADRELRRLVTSLSSSEKFCNVVATKGIKWHFTPPYGPHFGGIWEALVKSTKTLLFRLIRDRALTFEELYTVLARVEACLNSRPITPLSNDPNDLEALTPGHFLIGEPLVSIPQSDVTLQATNNVKRWRLVQQIQQSFWKRWHQEYLTTLQNRPKWLKKSKPLKVGTMVLVKEDNLPPLSWKIGRISAVYPGNDGQVRSASVRTAATENGRIVIKEWRRPAVKLAPLPFEDSAC